MKKTIVIPAAGLGSRLGEFTKNYSKAMCTLGEKPVFAHIIDKFDVDDEIIIVLGYKGELLHEIVQAYYPERNITFVTVDDYDGPKSGLGYSLSKAREYLQKPFIFWSCDTVFEYSLQELGLCTQDTNQMIVAQVSETFSDTYRHVKYNDETYKITEILPKDPNYKWDIHAYTGVAYIYDWKLFWDAVDENFESFRKDGETYCLNTLTNINAIPINAARWIDTGNRKIFERAKERYASMMAATILEKPEEGIWFKGNKVIKFHLDEKFISDRCERYNTILSDKHKNAGRIQFPQIISNTAHTYTYEFAEGIVASKIINEKIFKDIIDCWFDGVETLDIDDEEKVNIYTDFYKNKTLSRIKKYCELYTDIDNECVINGIKCLPATKLVKTINWKNIALNGLFTENYHGDFHLENMLINKNKFIMLDWRQNFGKSKIGDAFYDIAKMWHSLIVNHDMVKNNLFTIKNIEKNTILIDIHRTLIDTCCEEMLIKYLDKKGILLQSKLLTAIIFLNCAACHTYPYSRFLFNLGKLMINKFYKEHGEFWQ